MRVQEGKGKDTAHTAGSCSLQRCSNGDDQDGSVKQRTSYQQMLSSADEVLQTVVVVEHGAVAFVWQGMNERSTDPAPATTFTHLDATTVPLHSISELGVYPTIDPFDSKSQMLVSKEHYEVTTVVQKILQD
ncbi:hypothetical protein EDB89DRAFT_1912713 [Lactarius sanguifluus]|nr:hypothetical protein EDB89DRAFT_1912713 [Lactarius sanguifluus]